MDVENDGMERFKIKRVGGSTGIDINVDSHLGCSQKYVHINQLQDKTLNGR
jgi:hypothetical protein